MSEKKNESVPLVECYKQLNIDCETALGYQQAQRLLQLVGVELIEEEFGTRKAVEWYSKLWAKLAELDMLEIVKELNLKQVDLPAFLKVMKIWAERLGIPFKIVEATSERAVGHITRCWEAEYAEQLYGKQKSMEINQKIEPPANIALCERVLDRLGIPATVEFPQQICTGGKVCEYIFTLKPYFRNK